MASKPPRVSPAQIAAVLAVESGGWIAPTLTQSWSLLNGALGYWLPHGLNQGISNARALRAVR